MSVCRSPLEVQKVQDLPEWEQRYWCPDHWLRRWGCSTPLGEVDWKETGRTDICCVAINSSKPLSEHKAFATMITYTVMTLSLGSGGRPTVSCLWWEIRSVQAWGTNKCRWTETDFDLKITREGLQHGVRRRHIPAAQWRSVLWCSFIWGPTDGAAFFSCLYIHIQTPLSEWCWDLKGDMDNSSCRQVIKKNNPQSF